MIFLRLNCMCNVFIYNVFNLYIVSITNNDASCADAYQSRNVWKYQNGNQKP